MLKSMYIQNNWRRKPTADSKKEGNDGEEDVDCVFLSLLCLDRFVL